MRKIYLIIFLVILTNLSFSQYSLSGPTYVQDFNSLANTGSSGLLPAGWIFLETGSSANNLYSSGTGTNTIGDTYSFGIDATDRALGSLQSGSLHPSFGFYITNNTGSTITGIQISYTGEQWRLGNTGREDRLDFQYSLNAVSLNTGTWIDADPLDFIAPVNSGTTGALIGNNSSNQVLLTNSISSLTIPNHATFLLRWVDVDAAGSDDGLGIDDFTMTITSSIPSSTAYYRTVQSGLWNDIHTWATSVDYSTWVAATVPPDFNAKNIDIESGHTVTIASSVSADELTIKAGGTIDHLNGAVFTIYDGSGTDMRLYGNYIMHGTQPAGSGTIDILNGSLVKIAGNSSPSDGDNFAFDNPNVTFFTGSIYEWATTLPPQWSNQVYFTAGQNVVYRFTQSPSLGIGGNGPTIINGTLDPAVNITLIGTGDKTFVNGITGAGNITPGGSNPFTGNIYVTGTDALIGGTGIVNLPGSSQQLQIGPGTTATMSSDKTINGNITLSPNGYIVLGPFDLMVTGAVTGGENNYIKTNGTGSLILKNLLTLSAAPVGNSSYNPATINNPDGYDWAINVQDILTVDDPAFIPNIDRAVQRTWNIFPSVNPTATGTEITLSWNDDPAALPRQTGINYNNTEPVQLWRRIPHSNGTGWLYDWIAVGVTQVAGGVPGNYRTAVKSGWTSFSPFAVSTFSGPLPVYLISFEATKFNDNYTKIRWELSDAENKERTFEIEKAYDNHSFYLMATIPGNNIDRYYEYLCPGPEERNTYYRLKIVDKTGRITYSKVVLISKKENLLQLISFGPNPLNDKAMLHVNLKKSCSVIISIYNMSGILVKQWSEQLPAGASHLQFYTGNLANGMYYLSLKVEQEIKSLPFLKQ